MTRIERALSRIKSAVQSQRLLHPQDRPVWSDFIPTSLAPRTSVLNACTTDCLATLAGFEPSDFLRDREAGTAKLPHRAKKRERRDHYDHPPQRGGPGFEPGTLPQLVTWDSNPLSNCTCFTDRPGSPTPALTIGVQGAVKPPEPDASRCQREDFK